MRVAVFLVGIVSLVACNKPIGLESKPHINNTSIGETTWWRTMNDPILNQLIHDALENNNQIHEAKAHISQAKALLKAAYSAWLPTASISTGGVLAKGWDARLTPNGPLVNNPIFSNIDNLKVEGGYAGFVPGYSVNFLENTNNAKLARASLAMQRANFHAVRLSVISQTVAAYFNLSGQKQQYSEQKQLISNLEQLKYLEQLRYKDGASDYSAVSAINQEIAAYQAQTAGIEEGIASTLSSLQVLLNRDLGSLETKSLHKVIPKNIIPNPLPATVLKHRPDLIMARAQINDADAKLGLSYARLFPQISLTGLLGGASLDLAHLLKITTTLGGAQIAALVPVLNGATFQHISAAKSGVKAAYFNYAHILRSALADVNISLTKYQKCTEATISQKRAYQAALKSYRIVLARYEIGLQDKRAVLNSKINLSKAQLARTVAQIEQFNALVLVYQSVAGGY